MNLVYHSVRKYLSKSGVPKRLAGSSGTWWWSDYASLICHFWTCCFQFDNTQPIFIQSLRYFADLFIIALGYFVENVNAFGQSIAEIILVKICLTFFGTPDIYTLKTEVLFLALQGLKSALFKSSHSDCSRSAVKLHSKCYFSTWTRVGPAPKELNIQQNKCDPGEPWTHDPLIQKRWHYR